MRSQTCFLFLFPSQLSVSTSSSSSMLTIDTCEEESLSPTTILLYPNSTVSINNEKIDQDEVNKHHLLEKSNCRKTIGMAGISHRLDRRKVLYHRLLVISLKISFMSKKFSSHSLVVSLLISCVFSPSWVLF